MLTLCEELMFQYRRNVLNGKQHAKFVDRGQKPEHIKVLHTHTIACVRLQSRFDIFLDLFTSRLLIIVVAVVVIVVVGFCNNTQDGKGGGEKPKVLIVYQ